MPHFSAEVLLTHMLDVHHPRYGVVVMFFIVLVPTVNQTILAYFTKQVTSTPFPYNQAKHCQDHSSMPCAVCMLMAFMPLQLKADCGLTIAQYGLLSGYAACPSVLFTYCIKEHSAPTTRMKRRRWTALAPGCTGVLRGV